MQFALTLYNQKEWHHFFKRRASSPDVAQHLQLGVLTETSEVRSGGQYDFEHVDTSPWDRAENNL